MTSPVGSGSVVSLVDSSPTRCDGFTHFPPSQWRALRTTKAIERINKEFRRRTKTQASSPNEDAVVLLMYGLLCSGQIRLRRMVGWKDLPRTNRSVAMAEAA